MVDCPIFTQLRYDRLKWDTPKLGGQKNAIKTSQVMTLKHGLELLGKSAADGRLGIPPMGLGLRLFLRAWSGPGDKELRVKL